MRIKHLSLILSSLCLHSVLCQNSDRDIIERIRQRKCRKETREINCWPPFPWLLKRWCDEQEINSCDDINRDAILHKPPLDEKEELEALPLVINLHALGTNAPVQQFYADFDSLADKEKFYVLYPNGYSKAITTFFGPAQQFLDEVINTFPPESTPLSWNAGGCCPGASGDNIDDVGAIRMLLDQVTQKYNIDKKRVYVTGMSNGGFMTYRLACEMSDVIAAFAPVASVMMENPSTVGASDPFTCEPEKKRPILAFNDKDDTVVPYEKDELFDLNFPLLTQLLGFPSVDETIERWAQFNGVNSPNAKEVVYDDSGNNNQNVVTKCESYSPETSNTVTLCTTKKKDDKKNPLLNPMDNIRHCWPGQGPGKCENEIGNEYIWDFFKKYTLDGYVGEEDLTAPTRSEL